MDFTTNIVSTVSKDTIDDNVLLPEVTRERGRIEPRESSMSSTVPHAILGTTAVQTPGTGTLIKGWSSPSLSVPSHPIPQLACVIPAYNNELTIGTLVILSKKYAERVIVVDIGSTDRTIEVAKHAGADVLIPPQPCTRVQAILTGGKHALNSGCTAVVLIDSQGNHLTREIPRLAAPVLEGKADLVIGSRGLTGRKGIPAYNLDVLGKSCDLPKKSDEFRNSDPESTFRAFSMKGIHLLDFLPDTEHFESTMGTLFDRKGLAIKEIPIVMRHDLAAIDEEGIPKYRGKKVAVVVPAHNEELLIGETLSGIPDFVTRIYVVNDGSIDRTQEVIDYHTNHDPSIIPLIHETNKGAGAAISTGYSKALEDGMDIVATMDGDNQMDPSFLSNLLDPIIDGKCDFTMGNRLVNREFRKGMSKWRFFGNSILTILTKIASGYWTMVDPQNGFTAISRRALEKINVMSMYPQYGYLNDRLVRLNIWGFRVINIPHPARYGNEKSGIKYPTYISRVSWLLFKDFLWRLEMKYVVLSFHPLVFFYATGIIFTILAFILGIYSLYWKFVADNSILIPAIMTLILLSIGLQGIFFAMFFDMQQEKANNGWYM